MIYEQIAAYAIESMLYEVAATPKPGLVDRKNNGAHYDMNFFTFMSSAAGLHDTFDRLVRAGADARKNNDDIKEALPRLRQIGKEAEAEMFKFTNGVNTHKGMIFSLGILCGCAGWLLEEAEEKPYSAADNGNEKCRKTFSAKNICIAAKKMCAGLCEREFAGLEEKAELSKGEQMFIRYGYTGARGIAESGYEVVMTTSLPVYKHLRHLDISVNDALVHTLLYLIRDVEDTNIVSRHSLFLADFAMKKAKKAIDAGGMLSSKGRKLIQQMDIDFIEKYISPGGCADLLAVTHFLYCIENL